jgi:universal stress protein E
MVWKKILVAVSRTDTLEQPALERALALARKDGSELELLQVVCDSSLESYPLMPREEDYFDVRDMLVQRESAGLVGMVEELRRRGYAVGSTAVWDYPIYQGIVRRAVAIEADLVVSESLRGAKGRGLGSADWRLISGCPAPLLMVKSTGTAEYRHIAAAIDPFHTHDKPAALDEMILTRADEIARAFEAQLSAVYCLVPPTEIVALASRTRLMSPEAEAELEKMSKAALVDLLAKSGISPAAARVLRGTPSEVLPRLVADEAVDLLVMGALSRGRIAELIIGTTAADVLDSAECDLLVVKPPGFFSTVAAHVPPEPLTARVHPV